MSNRHLLSHDLTLGHFIFFFAYTFLSKSFRRRYERYKTVRRERIISRLRQHSSARRFRKLQRICQHEGRRGGDGAFFPCNERLFLCGHARLLRNKSCLNETDGKDIIFGKRRKYPFRVTKTNAFLRSIQPFLRNGRRGGALLRLRDHRREASLRCAYRAVAQSARTQPSRNFAFYRPVRILYGSAPRFAQCCGNDRGAGEQNTSYNRDACSVCSARASVGVLCGRCGRQRVRRVFPCFFISFLPCGYVPSQTRSKYIFCKCKEWA